MSFGATPEELLDLKPATAVRIVTPPGLAVAAALAAPPRARTGPVPLRLTLAWERGGESAAGMERWIDHVAAELIGPDAPARIASGELSSPLRDGDAVHPGDPRYAGRLFVELSGEIEAILDARRRGSRAALDPLDPRTFELVAPGCVLRAMTYLWVCRENGDGVHAQLTGMIALVRAAPGWELWQPAAAVLA